MCSGGMTENQTGTKSNGLQVVGDPNSTDEGMLYELLKSRMGNFGLSLEEEKSRLIEFGRFASDNCAKKGTKPQTFDFFGFTHYCSKSRDGRFRYEVLKSLFYWLNRRSQKKSYNMNEFGAMISSHHKVALPRIYVSIYAQ